VTEVFAIEGEAFGKLVLMDREPLVEGSGEGDRIDAVDEVVEGIVAGHDEVPAFAADVEPDGFALALAEGGAAFPNRFDVGRSDEQAMGDEAEHRDLGVAPGEGTAVIGDVVKGVREAAQVLVGEGTTRSGHSFTGAFLIDLRERRGAGEEFLRVFVQGIDPVFFGAFFIDVKFTFMASVSFAKSQRNPVAGFINGAFVNLRIAEAFGEEGAVSVFLLEVAGECAQGEAHAAGGEVGFAAGFEDEKSPELGDEGQATASGKRVPVDPVIAVLEPKSGARPTEDGAKNGVAFIAIGLVDTLPDGVSSGATRLEGVLGVEDGAKLIALELGGGWPDFKAPGDRITRGADMSRLHDKANLPVLG